MSLIDPMGTTQKSLLITTIFAVSNFGSSASAQFFDIQSATGSGSHAKLVPSRAIDGDTRAASRWSGNGNPEELYLDLGEVQRLDDAQIAWYLGDRRRFTFEIAAREESFDHWTTIFSGTSAGNTNDFENYNVNDMDARYVRIRGLSNSDGTAATAIREVTLSGTGGAVAGPDPDLGTQSPLPENAEFFDIQSATGIGSHSRLIPSRAIDGDTRNASRWSGSGNSEALILNLGADQDITDVQIAWYLGASGQRQFIFEIDARPQSSEDWVTIFRGTSDGMTSDFENYDVDDITASEVRIRGLSNSDGTTSTAIREVTISGNSDAGELNFGLDPNAEPWENFDLQDWVIDTPAFASDGESERFGENDWADISDASRQFFFTHTDGGMRFVSTVSGAKTSANTSYVRSELREMLRRGDKSISTQGVNGNNWALGYQPGNSGHGGRNGQLKATLRVNEVTSTGDGEHPGRTIIGQIHADNDEPLRLYYRKLPDAEFGCIYAVHEIRDSNDIHFNLMGDRKCRDNGPENGIQLNELFSYEITNEGADIDVVIRRGDQDGPIIAETTIDMDALFSGYDRVDEWMYFKAGLYTQNNTGDPDDRDVATFYRLSNTHDTNE